jgi:two-component system C4-dicarboxylate transport sensor histidine kinase DctB
MTSISKHLRNFARRPNKKLRAVKVQDVIRDTKEIISWRLSVAKVDLSFNQQDEETWVVADSVRLQQVLVNIISNAADAVEGQASRFIGIEIKTEPEKVQIAITDNGPGVPDAIAARIYDPFFSTKGVGKGLGLGLSISYNIVKDFDGELSVQNLTEGGAEFCISLHQATAPTNQETGKHI